MLIGRNVRRIRLEKGLTQDEFAHRSGFSQQYISDLERGRRNPTLVSLFELAQALGCGHADLLAEDDAPADRAFALPGFAPYAGVAETSWRFVDFPDLTKAQCAECARILKAALAHVPTGYQQPGEAVAQVESFFTDPERFAFAAVEGEAVLGWVGGIRTYPHAWELHPLVVDPARQRRGVGASLVRELETRCAAQGVLTLYLGSSDEFGGTNLFGRDLFPDALGHVAGMAPAGRGHPFTFYQRVGYEVVALIPDAYGAGQPEIFLAKRIAPPA